MQMCGQNTNIGKNCHSSWVQGLRKLVLTGNWQVTMDKIISCDCEVGEIWELNATTNESEEYCWLTNEQVINKLEGYVGNQSLKCPQATSCEL